MEAGLNKYNATKHFNIRTSAGFTLVELLVVLVIASLVGAVLFGGLGHVFNVRARLAPYLDQGEEAELVGDWFRSGVAALIPLEGDKAFQGTETTFTGATLMPLEQQPGVPDQSSWSLSFQEKSNRTLLIYGGETGQVMTIASWSGQTGRFLYYGLDGQWHGEWPNDKNPDTPLPLLIRLDAPLSGQNAVIVAAPQGPHRPLPPLGVLSQ